MAYRRSCGNKTAGHDFQMEIPLAQMTAGRVTNLYDLMDAACDAETTHRYVRGLGRVPLIDSNPRSGEKVLMDPAQDARYNQRTSEERVFSMLKDNHGGRHIRVRCPKKVMAHLLFGMLVGYSMSVNKSRSWIHTIAFSAIMLLTIYVILDLEFPRMGLIRVDATDQVLVELRKSMN